MTTAFDLIFSALELELGANNNIPVNICKTDNGYEMEFFMAGLVKEDIVVEYESSVLKVSSQYKAAEKEYLVRTIKDKKYSFAIEIKDIDFENSTAEYRDGVLYLTLPKTASVANRLMLK